jgi:hypothetical protein
MRPVYDDLMIELSDNVVPQFSILFSVTTSTAVHCFTVNPCDFLLSSVVRPMGSKAERPTEHLARKFRTDPAQSSGLRSKETASRWKGVFLDFYL